MLSYVDNGSSNMNIVKLWNREKVTWSYAKVIDALRRWRWSLLPVAGSYSVFHGKVTILADNPFYLGGTGIPSGKYMIFNLTTTQAHKDAWRDTGIMQVKLNTTTTPMKGTFYEIGTDFNVKTKTFDNHLTSGTIKQVKCR